MNKPPMLMSIHTGASIKNTGECSFIWQNTLTLHTQEKLKSSLRDAAPSKTGYHCIPRNHVSKHQLIEQLRCRMHTTESTVRIQQRI
uniref:Uncharacterized protein n=1 Tax=Arundo donax TaxID=35708 RepID=A0A0A9AP63_ARUDO